MPTNARRKFDALMLAIDDADKATNPDERTKLLREFMIRSNAFLEDYPFVAELWLLRAAASLELDYQEMGWIAKYQLDQLGMTDSDDPAFRRIMAQMERKQWLAKPPEPSNMEGWSNVRLREEGEKAQNGDAAAEIAVGPVLAKNPAYYSLAVDMYRKAAEQGSAFADDALRGIFELGSGVQQDSVEAARWELKAAKLGLPSAQFIIGQRIMYGWDNSPKNPGEGMRWIRKAAVQSYAHAEMAVGEAYRGGQVVARDDQQAIRWYRAAGRHALEQKYSAGVEAHIARIFSRDPDPKLRDGSPAVNLALAFMMTALPEEQEYGLETLAAAYAEAGDWVNAVATQQKLLELVRNNPNHDLNDEQTKKILPIWDEQLSLYQNKQPYREEEPVF